MENTYALIPLNSSQVIFNTEFRVARVALLLESDGKIRQHKYYHLRRRNCKVKDFVVTHTRTQPQHNNYNYNKFQQLHDYKRLEYQQA